MFEISAAPEIYQHASQQVYTVDLGFQNISDDKVVFETISEVKSRTSEHDQNLHGVLQGRKFHDRGGGGGG